MTQSLKKLDGKDKYNILLSILFNLNDESQLLKADCPTSSTSLLEPS